MSWLDSYYGKDRKTFDPCVVMEGVKYAVVLIRKSAKGSSSMGYVLLKKNGKHSVSPQKSLHEGVANRADMDRMIEELKRAEAQ